MPTGWGFGAMLWLSGVALAATLAMGAVTVFGEHGLASDEPASGIGTCWAESSDDDGTYEHVGCRDVTADYRVINHVSEPEQCTSEGYFLDEAGGAFCTESITH